MYEKSNISFMILLIFRSIFTTRSKNAREHKKPPTVIQMIVKVRVYNLLLSSVTKRLTFLL